MYRRGDVHVLHRECLPSAPLPAAHRKLLLPALAAFQTSSASVDFTVVQYSPSAGWCTFYNFDCNQVWPRTQSSWAYTRDSGTVVCSTFLKDQRPLLAAQAAVLPRWHPHYQASRRLAQTAGSNCDLAGLLPAIPTDSQCPDPLGSAEPSDSGAWISCLQENVHLCRLDCYGCSLASTLSCDKLTHKTAMRRYKASRPIKLALEDRLITPASSVLDYGCGFGDDVNFLNNCVCRAVGWDPIFRPNPEPVEADVVNLGYVINVIADPRERLHTLRRAYDLARSVLILSAQVHNGAATRHVRAAPFGDGLLTSRGTFQKLYKQKELRQLAEHSLGVKAFGVDLGIFYLFKSHELETQYRLLQHERSLETESRLEPSTHTTYCHRSLAQPQTRPAEMNDNGSLELSHGDTYGHRGPYLSPTPRARVGQDSTAPISYSATDVTYDGQQQILAAAASILLAGSHPVQLPTPFKPLPLSPSCESLYEQAHALVAQLSVPGSVERECKTWGQGKLLADALYFHVSLEPALPALLALILQAARNIGSRTNLASTYIKLARDGTAVSFALTEDFDRIDHPCLLQSTRVSLRDRRIVVRNYRTSSNPPILHRKDSLVGVGYPLYDQFRHLTEEEEAAGLLCRPDIGRRNQWRQIQSDASPLLTSLTRTETDSATQAANRPHSHRRAPSRKGSSFHPSSATLREGTETCTTSQNQLQ